MKPENLRLYRGEIGAMSALLQYVAGRKRYRRHPYATHPWWVLTTVPAHRALAAVAALDAKYHVLASTRAKAAARAAGIDAATAHLLAWPRFERHDHGADPVVDLYLLATHSIEPNMRDARNATTSLHWRHRYRLVRHSGRWTWRLTKAERQRLERLMRDAIGRIPHHPPREARAHLRRATRELLTAPRYRDIRRDVLTILHDARRLARTHGRAWQHALPHPDAVSRRSISGFPKLYEDRRDRAHTLGQWLYAYDHASNSGTIQNEATPHARRHRRTQDTP